MAIWLVILTGSAAVSMRLLGKYEARLCRWPRLTTLIVLLAIAAPIVLANMSFDESFDSSPHGGWIAKAVFGWPLIWHWYFVSPGDDVYGWDFSAPRLACNAVTWLVTLALVTLVWEMLMHRYRPRWRFSLRTMLSAVSLVSLLCAWSAMLWRRAQEQDALVGSIGITQVYVERWGGPKWLGLVVSDRFRRCIVGANVWVARTDEEANGIYDAEDPLDREDRNGERNDEESNDYGEVAPEEENGQTEDSLKRLGRLPALRFLEIECGLLTPAMADGLAAMRQLRMLELRMQVPWPDEQANVAWLGQLRQLEQLSLQGVGSENLACLSGLTRLQSLMLDISDCQHDEREMDKRLAMVGKLSQIQRVRLEGFAGARIAHLGSLNNLKSLVLVVGRTPEDHEQVHDCFEALGTLTQLEQLQLGLRGIEEEELRVDPHDLACLRGLKNLKSLRLHISCDESESHECLAALASLTQLRQLWLEGNLVSVGLSELAPLGSLEELTSDYRMSTPAALESMMYLERLKAVHIAGIDQDLASSDQKAVDVRRALASLRRSHPGIVVDDDFNDRWLDAQKEDYPSMRWDQPFYDRASDLDSVLDFDGFPMGP
ncbi:MAG TPA: hypothetical protein VFI31_04375 [Pirellulales bacterium]|nr:hypothetical protein [Pirellulales bacterium]